MPLDADVKKPERKRKSQDNVALTAEAVEPKQIVEPTPSKRKRKTDIQQTVPEETPNKKTKVAETPKNKAVAENLNKIPETPKNQTIPATSNKKSAVVAETPNKPIVPESGKKKTASKPTVAETPIKPVKEDKHPIPETPKNKNQIPETPKNKNPMETPQTAKKRVKAPTDSKLCAMLPDGLLSPSDLDMTVQQYINKLVDRKMAVFDETAADLMSKFKVNVH